MIRSLKIGLLIIGVALPMFSSAQNDFAAWTGIDLRVPVNKKLETGLQIEGRFDNNMSEVQQTFLSPYLKYEIHKKIGAGVAYRFSNRPESGFFGPVNKHRIGLDLSFKDLFKIKTPLGNSKFDIRLRYTHRTNEGELNSDYFRTRFKLDLDVKKFNLKPFVATEFFFHFNDQLTYTSSTVSSVHRFNKYRIIVGTDYQIKKRHELSLVYIIEPVIESTERNFILSLGYKYEMKLKKKKK